MGKTSHEDRLRVIGSGNAPLETFVAVSARLGIESADLYAIMDVAEDLVVPLMERPIRDGARKEAEGRLRGGRS